MTVNPRDRKPVNPKHRTWEDDIHKFSMNIPLAKISNILKRQKELGFKNLCDYVLTLVENDVEYSILHKPVYYIPTPNYFEKTVDKANNTK